MGINKDNVNDFRYRVVENDSTELVPWSRIPGLEQKYGAKQAYGFIGKFRQPGKQLMVEVRNIQHYSIRDAVIFDWRTDFKPQLKQIGLFAHINGRTQYINVKDHGFSDGIDPKTNVPLNFKFRNKVVEDIQLFFGDHFGVPYSITVKSEMDGASGPFKNAVERDCLDNSYMLPRRQFYYPGKYEIIVNRSDNFGPLSEKEVLRIPFVVLPEPFLSTPPRIETVITWSVFILTMAGLIFMSFYQRSKQKLRRAAQEKQMAGLQLKSIRSQLNPHFMFNALSSIQNLINKNHIEEANFYLSKFAGLTRQVLDNSNEEMTSLEDEVQLLNDYLQMEQLRFSFNYELSIEERLNPANIEIPAMLLQPFIENAVKHGISGLKERGQLSLKIRSAGKDLTLTIADNGRGFDKSIAHNGYGLKLSEERIALLNQLYKEQALSLQIETGNTGTLVTIRLSNWIP